MKLGAFAGAVRIGCLLLVVAACGTKSTVVAGDGGIASPTVPGRLTPATGLAASDYEVWSTASDAPAAADSAGAFQAVTSSSHTGVVFAAPKTGSGASRTVGAESGLYMAPSLGTTRIVASASGYSVATTGDMAIDATTTVLAMLLMHPVLAHPSLDVSTMQVGWMVARLGAGWPCVGDAAKAYDAALATGADFSNDTAFGTAFTTCLDDVADITEFAPPMPSPTSVSRHILQAMPGSAVSPSVAQTGVVVGSLKQKAADASGATMTPATRTGTALDYRYIVRKLDPAAATGATSNAIFKSPNQLVVNPTSGQVADGYIPSSSYFSYLDVVGNTLKKLNGLVTSTLGAMTGLAPTKDVLLAAPGTYEVRLISGGLGSGYGDPVASFAIQSLGPEYSAAFTNNLTIAAVEALTLIPGVNEMLGDDAGQKTLMAAVQQAVLEVQKLVASSQTTTGITGTAIYDAMYTVLKKTVDTYISQVVDLGAASPQQGWLRRGFTWAVSGGKKFVKFVGAIPARIAKGGAAANRVFRLAKPESVLEYFVVVVGDAAAAPQITSLSPAQGPAGTVVTLLGQGFGIAGEARTVTFNGVNASPVGWITSSQLSVAAPAVGSSGPVVVTFNGVKSNGVAFTYTSAVLDASPGVDATTPADASCGKDLTNNTASATQTVSVGKTSGTLMFTWDDGGVYGCNGIYNYVLSYEGKQLYTTACGCGSVVNLPYSGTSTYVTLNVSLCPSMAAGWWKAYVACP
jgi:hypothetical protein